MATKGSWSRSVRARAPITVPVARSAASPRVHFFVLLIGPVAGHGGRSCRHLFNAGVASCQASWVDDAARVTVRPNQLTHGRRGARAWSGCGATVALCPARRACGGERMVRFGWCDPRLGKRLRVTVATRSSPPAVRRRFPLAPRGSGGLPTPMG